jgi:formate hydrogenlyase subunit 4
MTARTAALIATLALIALLTVLTIDVMIENGIDILVVLSLLVLAMFGFGVVGALTNPPQD